MPRHNRCTPCNEARRGGHTLGNYGTGAAGTDASGVERAASASSGLLSGLLRSSASILLAHIQEHWQTRPYMNFYEAAASKRGRVKVRELASGLKVTRNAALCYAPRHNSLRASPEGLSHAYVPYWPSFGTAANKTHRCGRC